MRAFSVILLFLFSFNTFPESSLEVVAVDEPPANFVDEEGASAGIAVDVLKAMQQALGETSGISFMPEARAINISRNEPNVILLSISRTPFREEHYHWIGPVLKKNWLVYTKKGNEQVSNIDTLKQLGRLGVVRGDVREEWLVNRKFNNLHSVTRHEQNLQMLLRGRTDAIVYEQFGMIYLAESLGLSMSAFSSGLAINQSDVYIAMSISTPIAEVKKWRKAYQIVKNNGELDAINLKWQRELIDHFNALVDIDDGYLIL